MLRFPGSSELDQIQPSNPDRNSAISAGWFSLEEGGCVLLSLQEYQAHNTLCAIPGHGALFVSCLHAHRPLDAPIRVKMSALFLPAI